jgi:hypothetical protein
LSHNHLILASFSIISIVVPHVLPCVLFYCYILYFTFPHQNKLYMPSHPSIPVLFITSFNELVWCDEIK